MRVMRVMRVMGVMWRRHTIANSPVQRDSEISIFGRLSGMLCWPHGHRTENSLPQRDSKMSNLRIDQTSQTCQTEPKCSPAQRHSKMSNLAEAVKNNLPQRHSIMSSLGVLGILRWKTKSKNSPVQRDSGISILKTSPYRPYGPYCPLDFKNRPAQRHSIMSILRVLRIQGSLGMPGWETKSKNSPAQRDSIMSNPVMGLIGPMGHIGLMGKKPANQNSPAQWDSGTYNLGIGDMTEPQCAPAQRDSGIYNLKVEIESTLPQRHSKMSNLGHCPNNPLCPYCPLDLKTSFPQRNSEMSNLGGPGNSNYSWFFCVQHCFYCSNVLYL